MPKPEMNYQERPELECCWNCKTRKHFDCPYRELDCGEEEINPTAICDFFELEEGR